MRSNNPTDSRHPANWILALGIAGRNELLEADGGCIPSPSAATLCRTTQMEIEHRVSAGNLVGIRNEDGVLMVPVWQFDHGGQPLRGIPEALRVLAASPGYSDVTPFHFFLMPHPRTAGRPLDALRRGNVADVIGAAQCELD